MAGVSVLVLILVLSFAIDRAAKAVLFLSSLFRGPWSRWLPEPQTLDDVDGRGRAEKMQTLAYYVLAGIRALGVLAGFGGGEAKGQPLEITGKLILEDRARKVE